MNLNLTMLIFQLGFGIILCFIFLQLSCDAPCTSYRPIVYSDGSCIGNGVRMAKAGVGVYWGAGSR